MPGRPFPALGFDPAPGEPAVLTARAARAGAVARALAAASAIASRLGTAGWTGDAAEACRGRLRDLPRDLELAAAAHGTLASALTDYGDGLASRQRRAGELERRAAELRRLQAAAGAEVEGLVARAEARRATLAAVLADAHRLHGEHRAAAGAAAGRIRAATTPPHREPGRLARTLGAARRWIAGNADVLASISTVLRGLSGGLAVLCLVPGFQVLAPLAMGTAALALALDVAVKAGTGRGSWTAIALDAVLSALPAGPVSRALTASPAVAGALRAANRAIPAKVKGPAFRAIRTLPEGISREQLAGAAVRIRAAAGHLGDDVVVQGSRAGHCARARSDVDFGIRVAPERYDELVRECFRGATGTGEVAMANAVERGRIFWRRAGLRELHDGLQADLGRKVDLAVIKRGGLFDGEPWLRVR